MHWICILVGHSHAVKDKISSFELTDYCDRCGECRNTDGPYDDDIILPCLIFGHTHKLYTDYRIFIDRQRCFLCHQSLC